MECCAPTSETKPTLGKATTHQSVTGEPDRVVYVLDRDREVRSGVNHWLSEQGYSVRPFGTVESLLSCDKPQVPSCLILDQDISLSNAGLELIRDLKLSLAPSVILMGESRNLHLVVKAIRNGATHFLDKPVIPELLLQAVRDAFDEVIYNWNDTRRNLELKEKYATLTPRERQILPFVVQGFLNKQTAFELGTSEVTIRIHRGQIMRKMSANSLADLVRSAVRIGISRL